MNEKNNNIELTKREYFALVAMEGLFKNLDLLKETSPDYIAARSVCYADCLLAELSKPTSCNIPCSPSDYYKGGLCDRNGCYNDSKSNVTK